MHIHNTPKTIVFKSLVLLCLIVFIQGCQLKYKQIPSENFDIQLAEQTVSTTTLNHKQLKELKFNNFKNGSIVDFKEGDNSFVFKIIRNYQSSELQTLLVMPHYLSEVSYVDGDLKNFHTIRRNMYSKDRQYSPNIIAFDLNNENHISYVFVKNTVAKKIQFLVQNRNYVKNYDQKLIITFTSVYSIILTLIFVNLIFFFYIRKISYLYYSFFILTTLFSILFQEGWIAYFQHLSLPIFGIYTRVIWIKLPSLFFWLFVISFLDLKTKSRFDYRLSRVMLILLEFMPQ